MRSAITALVTAMALVACGGGSSDPGAPSAGDDTTWGPLAVGPASDGTMDALTVGTIRITDTCVYLEEGGDDVAEGEAGERGATNQVLLIWAANWTRWDPDDEAVLYAPFGNAPVRLRDGDRVSLGGGGASADEGGIGQQRWVNPPDPSCPTGHVWVVGEVVSAEPAS